MTLAGYEPTPLEEMEPLVEGATPVALTRDGPVNAPQVKRLEARITRLGLDRERVKDWCRKRFQVEHLNELSFTQYQRVNGKLQGWADEMPHEKRDPILTGNGGMDVGAIETAPVNEEAAALRVKAHAIREAAEHAEGEAYRQGMEEAAALERQAWELLELRHDE